MKPHWLDNPGNVRKLWLTFQAVLVLVVLAGFFVDLHPHFDFEGWFAFNAAFGFMTCLAMIVVAKGLGTLLKRNDHYYAQEDQDE